MEAITTAISFILLTGLILTPILILWKLNKFKSNYKFISYISIGLAATLVFALTYAWWSDTADKLLLEYYGYNIDGMNEKEFYGNVAPENLKRVKGLETSIMGVGWPLKAIMTYVIYLPYFLIVYFASSEIKTSENKNYT